MLLGVLQRKKFNEGGIVMGWIGYVIMLVGAIVMIYGLKKYKTGQMWGKGVAILGALVALGCALANLFTGGQAGTQEVQDMAAGYSRVKGAKVGQYLASNYSGKKVVIVKETTMTQGGETTMSEAMLQGLKSSLQGNVTLVDTVAPEMPEDLKEEVERTQEELAAQEEGEVPMDEAMGLAGIPFDSWFTADIMDDLVDEYKGKADIMVFACNMPMDYQAAEFWRDSDVPKLVVLSGPVSELTNAIKQGKVIAAVMANPDAEYEQKPPPTDVDEAFGKRYLLLTPDNVEEIASKYQERFGM